MIYQKKLYPFVGPLCLGTKNEGDRGDAFNSSYSSPVLKVDEDLSYLSFVFSAEGQDNVTKDKLLQILTKILCKPQQCLFAFRSDFLPGIYQKFFCGASLFRHLKIADIQFMRFI